MSRPLLHFGLPCAALLAACTSGGDATDCYADPIACIDAAGTDHAYVIDDLILPADADGAEAMALDLDGDGEPDNQLGKALATFQIQSEVDLRLERGDAILLLNLRSTDLSEATEAGMWVLNGANPDPSPCSGGNCGRHLQGGASFTVSTPNAGESVIAGAIGGGAFDGGPGRLSVYLALSSDGPPLALDLIGARVKAQVSAGGIVAGTLAGAVHEDDLDTAILPAVVDVLGDVIAADCPYSAPDCCVAQSNGAILLALLDENDNCEVSITELGENSIVQQLLRSDVDLLDNTGAFAPGENDDNESVSLAVQFTATTATFPAP